jgi:hypothetical protein
MKTLTLILSLFLLLSVHVSMADDPAELVKLRATYDNSLRGEFQKVGKLYHGRLVELKDNYMEAKNLEGAVAVDAEIKKLRETHGKMVVKVSEPQRKASPLDGVWHQYIGSKKWIKTIKGDRMLDETGISRYTVKNGVVKIHREDGYWWELKIHPDNPDVMEGAAKGGTKTKWVRFKW